jgi:hypothetical protein
MGRVREKKRWRKEKKWRDREEEEETSPPEPSVKVRPLKLRKEALNTGQRLKTKVERAVKFSPLGFCPGSATAPEGNSKLQIKYRNLQYFFSCQLDVSGWLVSFFFSFLVQ